MPSQFQMAFNALRKKNTENFNTKYGKSNTGKRLSMRRPRSQFEIAREAIRSRSPEIFNEGMSNSSRPSSPLSFGGASPIKTPPKKSQVKKARRGAMTYKNAGKIRLAFTKPPIHPQTRKLPRVHKVIYMNNIHLNNASNLTEAQMNKILKSLPKYD